MSLSLLGRLVVPSDTGDNVGAWWWRVVSVVDSVGLAEFDEFVLGVGAEDLVAAAAGQGEGCAHWPRSWFIVVISAFWVVTMFCASFVASGF